MRRIYIVFLLVLNSFVFSGNAQQTDQRTWDTKTADIVMLLPAENTQTLNRLMGELNSLGGEVVPYMASMLSEPGKGDDSKIRYAIAGLGFYVSQSGKEKDRQAVAAGLCKAIDKASSDEIRDFLLIQLQYVAGEESIETVNKLLKNDRLCDPAVRVLVRIGTESAKKVLLNVLKNTSDDNFRISIAEGLGDLRYQEAAVTLEKMTDTNNSKLKHVVLHALAEITSLSSKKTLEKAVQQTGYVYEATDALGAYVLYLSNVLKNGSISENSKIKSENFQLVRNVSKDLMKKASVPQMIAARSAGLSLYALSAKENAIPEIIKALDSPYKIYRGTALSAALNIHTPAMIRALLEKAGNEKNPEVKSEIIYALGFKGDKSAIDFVESNINVENTLVKKAAIVATGRLNGENSYDKIVRAINADDDQVIATAQQTLLTIKNPQLITRIASEIPQANSAARIALIEILSQRNAVDASEVVFAQAASSNPDVKLAAEQALKNLSVEKDLGRLSTLLSKASGEKSILALQEALFAAVRNSGNADKQTDLIVNQMQSLSKPELFYNVLAMIGGKKGLEIVKNTFDTGNENVKDLAFKALADWADFTTAPTLFSIAQSNPSGIYFDKALTGYVKKINPSDNSPEQKSLYLRQALEVAATNAQKISILEELSKTGAFSALSVVGAYLDSNDDGLQQTAVQAVYRIVLSNNEVYGETVKPLIDKSITMNKSPEAEYQKEEILKRMAAWPKEGGAVKYELSAGEVKEGFVPMFNGIDMTGWVGNLKDYVAKDGMIVCDPRYGGHGNLYTEKEYSDFIMRFDFLLTPAANNGLGIRAPLEGDAAYVGMELQILDNTADVYKNLKPYQYHGSVYGIIPSKTGFLKPVGEWNTQEVVAKGNHIKITLNGVVILDGDIAKASKNFTKMPDERQHPGLSNKKGHIGFLGHGSYVSFKNLRIKEID